MCWHAVKHSITWSRPCIDPVIVLRSCSVVFFGGRTQSARWLITWRVNDRHYSQVSRQYSRPASSHHNVAPVSVRFLTIEVVSPAADGRIHSELCGTQFQGQVVIVIHRTVPLWSWLRPSCHTHCCQFLVSFHVWGVMVLFFPTPIGDRHDVMTSNWRRRCQQRCNPSNVIRLCSLVRTKLPTTLPYSCEVCRCLEIVD